MPTRREVFGYLGAGAAIGVERVAGPRVVHALALTASDPAAPHDLNLVVAHYRQTFRKTHPAVLYREILGVRAHAGALLDRASAPRLRAELTAAVGWLSNLLALATHDLGERAAALVWCADAERHGEAVGHPELAGWAAQTRVLMCFYDGRAGDAVDQALRGQQATSPGTVAHAKLVAQEMRAWALLGDAERVTCTRRRAEKVIEALRADAPTRDTFSISLADDPPYTATSLLLLGRHREAEEATRRVIARFYGPGSTGPSQHPSGFARTYLVLALALAGLGRLDEAHAAGCAALEAPRPAWPVAVLASRLDRALRQNFPRTAEARDYHDRYVCAVRTETAGGAT